MDNKIFSLFFFRISILKMKHEEKNGTIDTDTQTKLDIKCLQVLRATMYNEIVKIDKDERERNPDNYRKYVI